MNQQTTAAAAKDDSSVAPSTAPAVVLVGLNGFGRQHLGNIQRLASENKISFLAGIDPKDPGSLVRGENTRIFTTLDEFLESGLKPDIIINC